MNEISDDWNPHMVLNSLEQPYSQDFPCLLNLPFEGQVLPSSLKACVTSSGGDISQVSMWEGKFGVFGQPLTLCGRLCLGMGLRLSLSPQRRGRWGRGGVLSSPLCLPP